MNVNKKIDFAVVIKVKNSNPNGDPINENRPRKTNDGLGEITDVCIKRKIRDRLMDFGCSILVQSDHRKNDEHTSLKSRLTSMVNVKGKKEDIIKSACENWFDVRAFGQLIALKKSKSDDGDSDAVSVGIKGAVSIGSAFSIEPIEVTSTQITKSLNGEDVKGGGRGNDTMGMKHRVDYGVYVAYGAIYPLDAEKNGFTEDDAKLLQNVLTKLFENDSSSARPAGSMEVMKVIWWKHNSKCGACSSAKVHRSLKIVGETITVEPLEDIETEIIRGF